MRVYGSSGGLPVGACVWFPHGSTPTGGTWLKANGQNVSRAVYSALFGLYGTTWGAGDGSTTFTLPDMRRRSPVGAGGSGTGTLGNTVGSTGGAETHALSAAENGPHSHNVNTYSSNGGGSSGYPQNTLNESSHGASGGTTSSGSGTGHNTYHPVAVGEFWVKA